jgi:diguanylate cyclase (GGDEF)-like protein/PAS domain S-box-containing protein
MQVLEKALIEMESRIESAVAEWRKAEEYTNLMLNSSPLCCQLWNEDFEMIDCNDAALRLYGFEDKKQYMDNWRAKCSLEYQPDGQMTREKARSLMTEVLATGATKTFDWAFQTSDGEPLPTEVTLGRVKHDDEYVVTEYIRDLREIKDLERKAEKIYYDPLTSIYNRRYLDENIGRLLKTLSRTNSVFSLIMIDIDCFKKYNDTYGHKEGDACLKKVAEALSNSVARDADFAARYGGEEFAVVLPNTDESGGRLVAEKILKNVRSLKIPHRASDVAEFVTASLGVATGNVDHLQSGDDYVKRADEMLYQSKQGGRDRYTFGKL